MSVQKDYKIHADTSEPLEAKIKNVIRKQGSSPTLELQVNIGAQDHTILLPLSELDSHELPSQAVIKELRKIRKVLDKLPGHLVNLSHTSQQNNYKLDSLIAAINSIKLR